VGDAPRLLEAGEDLARHVAHVEDVHQLAAQVVHPRAQLVPLADQPAVDDVLEHAAHRLEEDEDDEEGWEE
jgi:hypothetical protein